MTEQREPPSPDNPLPALFFGGPRHNRTEVVKAETWFTRDAEPLHGRVRPKDPNEWIEGKITETLYRVLLFTSSRGMKLWCAIAKGFDPEEAEALLNELFTMDWRMKTRWEIRE